MTTKAINEILRIVKTGQMAQSLEQEVRERVAEIKKTMTVIRRETRVLEAIIKNGRVRSNKIGKPLYDYQDHPKIGYPPYMLCVVMREADRPLTAGQIAKRIRGNLSTVHRWLARYKCFRHIKGNGYVYDAPQIDRRIPIIDFHAALKLRQEGKSFRDIADRLSMSHETARHWLNGKTEVRPESVIGRDGKQYAASRTGS